jgi:hypothetical protein
VQRSQLPLQDRLVPAAIFRNSIVGNAKGLSFLFRSVVEHNHGQLFQPNPLSRQDSPVAGDHVAMLIHQDGIYETILPDAPDQLPNLSV